jgi:PKD repeat protein
MKRALLSFFALTAFGLGLFAQTWITQGTGFTATSRGVQNIFAVDDQVVWLTGYDGSGSNAACQDFSRTVNGGTVWTPGVVTGATGLSNSMICAIDGSTAWAAMYWVSGSNTAGIYKTTDGGTTWNRQASAAFTNSSFPNIVYFWNANDGVCMGDPVGGEFEIYTTNDGGTTWVKVPGANIPNPASGEYGYTSNCWVVGDNIWFGTNKGHIFKSADKGYNWSSSTPPGMTGKNVVPCFKDATNGFCMKYLSGSASDTLNLLDISSDGGTTFTAFSYAGMVFNDGMSFIPGSTGTYTSIGVNTTIGADRFGLTFSFDDAATWAIEQNLFGTQITAQEWLNDSTGWVATFNSGPTDGIFKFNGVLAPAVANFIASDSNITLGSQVTFTNLSTGKPTTQTWTFEGGAPGSSTQKNPPPITYNTPGDFTVTLRCSNSFGSDTLEKVDYIHVGGVGINEASTVTLTLFPNPVRDVLKIDASQTIQEIQVINQVGQVVLEKRTDSRSLTVATSDLNAGVYTLKVKINEKFYVRKIVVN